jgi:uncharacterized protein
MAQQGTQAVVLSVRLHPRAHQNQITQILPDGTLKISLTASPVEGKANQALIAYLSAIFDIPRDQVTIVAGARGRNKLVRVAGLSPEVIDQRVASRVQNK